LDGRREIVLLSSKQRPLADFLFLAATSFEWSEAYHSLTLIDPWLRDALPNFIQKLHTAVLLYGPWKVAGWIMLYKTLYPTRRSDEFDRYLEKLSACLHGPGRFAALKGLGFSPKTASAERIGRVRTPALVVMGTKDGSVAKNLELK